MRARGALLCVPILLLAAAPAAAADQCAEDCTHPEKACVCALDAVDNGVSVVPLGGVGAEPVEPRRALEVGDELSSADDNAVLSVTCAGGSDITLHGRFRAVIMPAEEGQDCALNLLAGAADVLTDDPTSLASGETLMGSRRTQYGMRVARGEEGATVECVVFEGEAEVRNRRADWNRVLTASRKAAWQNGRLVGSVRPVSGRDIRRAALVYSRADLARARVRGARFEDPVAVQRALVRSHAAILARPGDPTPRIELAALQTNARMPRQALYQLNKAERLEPARPDQRTTIAATKYVAYKQIGREQEAAEESEKVRRLDPDRYRELMRVTPERLSPGRATPERVTPGRTTPEPETPERTTPGRASPEALQPARDPDRRLRQGAVVSPEAARRAVLLPLAVKAAARPAALEPGSFTTIVVSVTSPDGSPIAGATVTVVAGGGSFRGTRSTRAETVTDARGTARMEWACRPCAPNYRLDVAVSKSGYVAGRTAVDVRTR